MHSTGTSIVSREKPSMIAVLIVVLPVAVTDHTSEFIRVEINGVNICGSTDDLRRLLGI